MRRFLKEHGYDTALAVFLLVFGGSIISLFGDVLAAFGSYPWAVAACCGLSLVVGLGISAIADRRAVMVAKIHEDGETERLRLRHENESATAESAKREEARRKLLQFSNEQLDKMLVCFMRENAGKGALRSDIDDTVCGSLVRAGVFLQSQAVGDAWEYNFVLQPEWRLFVAENEEAIRSRVAAFREGRRGRRSKRAKE